MKTKIFTLLFAVAASVGTVFASVTIDGIAYNLNETDLTAEVTNGGNYTGSIVIPENISYETKTYSVTSIGELAFAQCTGLTSITIPNSVTLIGEGAFWYSVSLTSVTIGNSVTSIGNQAFDGCTGLTSVTIGNSIISIGNDAFYDCNVKTIHFSGNLEQWFSKSWFPGAISGKYALYIGEQLLTDLVIPNTVTDIGRSTFAGCTSLTFVSIPSSVTSIGDHAFSGCTGLTSVTIPNSVTSIGDWAFDGCTNLTDIYATCGDLDRIKKLIGYNYLVKYQPLPYTITVKNAPNGKVNYPQNICDALEITATPDRGYYFVKWADGNTENPRTIELTQDTTMEAIFDYLLTGKCGKDNELNWKFDPSTMALNISKAGSLTENYTYGTFMELLTIGNEITIIGQSAFAGCGNLRTVILGSSVKVLEENAFNGCTALETITCYSQRPPTVNNYALYGLDYSTIVYVPADYLETYKMHDAWGLYDVRSLGATTTQTDEVTVEPTETTAEVAWPTVSGAYTYDLVIKDKAGNPVCTLTFNAIGQLTSIAFHAPARNQSQQQTQAAGFSFTITGLEAGTTYDLTITAKDNNGTTIDEKALSFTTASQSMSIDETVNRKSSNRKLIIGGHLYILRNGKMYNVQGAEVK